MSSHGSAHLAATPTFPAAVFVVALVAAVVATDLARTTVPALQGRVQIIAQAERPPDGDHYLANDVAGHVDHHVIYFGIDDEVMANLRAAEVLFLGNSRLMFALRPGVLRPFFDADAVPYYVMGFGFREADRFPLAIIRALDLRPRLVVVNADGFFGGGLSPWADVVIRDTPFAARKLQFEAEAPMTRAGSSTNSCPTGCACSACRVSACGAASSPTGRAWMAPGRSRRGPRALTPSWPGRSRG